MKRIFTLVSIFAAIVTITLGYMWYRNPHGNYEPIITIIAAVITAGGLLVRFLANQRGTSYDAAKIDRILAIYDSIKSFIAEIQQRGTADNDLLIQLLRQTKHAKVLFKDSDVSEHVDLLYKKGLDLEYIEKAISKARHSDMERLLYKRQKIFTWFCEQHSIVDELLRPYLNR